MEKTFGLVAGIFLIGIFLISFSGADGLISSSPTYTTGTSPMITSNNLYGVGTPVTSGGFSNPSAYGGFSNPTAGYSSGYSSYQYSQPNFNQYYSSDQISTYWPILTAMQNGQCTERSDFLITIAPAGCSPTVVRSDLLEEQNVPVFCQLSAIKINPLIQVSAINAISFKGNYPPEVAGISFHPARAAVRTYQTLLGSPLMDNIGYVVIVLKQNTVEKNMSDWVSGNLTATIQYDAEQAFGAGQSEYFVPILDDSNWSAKYQDYGFWNGKGFIRVEDIQNGSAKIALYSDKDHLFREMVLNEGQTSDKIYFPGFYCLAGLQVELNRIVAPDKQAKLNVDGNLIWVREGSSILNGRCTVRQINALDDGSGSISISCPGGTLNLLNQKQGAVIIVNSGLPSSTQPAFKIGDLVVPASSAVQTTASSTPAATSTPKPTTPANVNYYLAYVGQLPKNVLDKNGNPSNGQRIAILVGAVNPLSDNDLVNIASRVSQVSSSSSVGGTYSSATQMKLADFLKQVSLGNAAVILFENSPETPNGVSVTLQPLSAFADSVVSATDPKRKLLDNYFDKSTSAANDLITNYPLEKSADGLDAFGEQTLLDEINLAKQIGRTDAVQSLSKLFEKTYPNSKSFYYVDNLYSGMLNFDFTKAYATIPIDNNYHTIGLDALQTATKNMKSTTIRVGGFYAYDVQEGCKVYMADGKIDCSGVSPANNNAVTSSSNTVVITPMQDGSTEFKFSGGLWSVRAAIASGGSLSNIRYFSYQNNNWVDVGKGNPQQIQGDGTLGSPFKHDGETQGIAVDNNGKPYIVYYYTDSDGVGRWHSSTQSQQSLQASSSNTNDYVVVNRIDPTQVSMSYVYYDTTNSVNTWKTETLSPMKVGDYTQRGSPLKVISVNSINVQSMADISIVPQIDNTQTETNFSFKIGIEKRAIQLSPEKTQDMINNLNKTISKWEDINNKLTTLITAWKGACFATSGVLMLKNLVSGFSGESMARQNVMKGYQALCASQVGAGKKYSTNTECYNAYSSQIDSDVQKYSQALQDENTLIENTQNKHTQSSGGLLDGGYVDSNATLNDLKSQHVGQSVQIMVTGPDGKPQPKIIQYSDMTSTEQIRAADTYNKLQAAGASQTILNSAQQNLNAQLMSVYNQIQTNAANTNAALTVKDDFTNKQALSVVSLGGENLKAASYTGSTIGSMTPDAQQKKFYDSSGKLTSAPPASTPIQVVTYNNNQQFLLTLKPTGTISSSGNQMGVDKVYQITSDGKYQQVNTSKVIKDNTASVAANNIINQYAFITQGPCKNAYKNAKIQFYENSPSSKLPAIVPFDLDAGWYVKVPNTVGGLLSSSQQGYTAAGQPSFFYVCNVGPNGNEENMGGDDICQSFDVNNYANVKSFSGCTMTASDVQNLAQRAVDAVRQAAQQYGKNPITINGKSIQVAQPMTESLTECQDFMSPEDCKILFNVCDPVICPSSRCNLGGAYPNSDVVQTGIIGSIVLCLPNIKEGIIVPVCLTGINAGIEEFVSILKSERDCLQTSLTTGEHVGICDEITSIYLCEFFWRQLAPVLNLIIPKMIEAAYGQGARGGGEYLTVMNSWDNLQNSISYFKDNYAKNSFAAFQARSVTEAGGEFCRAFIGTNLPSDWNALLAPESPTQIYAWFSEAPYTEATVPATSQYKIYYHIYAGKDQGVQYQVYLKNPPASSYYNQNQIIVVRSGYIAQGQEADQTVDFTAPAGYKQLCVDYNGQENCGFSEVTTDFALNYLQQKYIADQANQTQITSEKTCISGSPSMLPLVNPNLEAGVAAATQPQIAMNGIVRVCATYNPGNATDPNRWQNVGNCGTPSLGCWLDTYSVKNAVNQVSAIDNTIAGISGNMQDVNGGGLYTDMQTKDLINGIGGAKDQIKALTDASNNGAFAPGKLSGQGDIVINEAGIVNYIENTIQPIIQILDNVTKFGYLNADKAQAYSLKAQVYQIVTKSLQQDFFSGANNGGGTASGGTTTPTNPTSPTVAPSSISVASDELASGGKTVTFTPIDQQIIFNTGSKQHTINAESISSDGRSVTLEVTSDSLQTFTFTQGDENTRIHDFNLDGGVLTVELYGIYKNQNQVTINVKYSGGAIVMSQVDKVVVFSYGYQRSSNPNDLLFKNYQFVNNQWYEYNFDSKQFTESSLLKGKTLSDGVGIIVANYDSIFQSSPISPYFGVRYKSNGNINVIFESSDRVNSNDVMVAINNAIGGGISNAIQNGENFAGGAYSDISSYLGLGSDSYVTETVPSRMVDTAFIDFSKSGCSYEQVKSLNEDPSDPNANVFRSSREGNVLEEGIKIKLPNNNCLKSQ